MKKALTVMAAALAACLLFSSYITAQPQGFEGGGPPRKVSPAEIDKLKSDYKETPTSAANFDKRAEVVDGWIRLILMGSRDKKKIGEVAPPGALRRIKNDKLQGNAEEAFKSLDRMIEGLSGFEYNFSPGNEGRIAREAYSPRDRERGFPSREAEFGADRPPMGGGGPKGQFVAVTFPTTMFSTADVEVDYQRSTGLISPYIAGTIAGSDTAKTMPLAKEAWFRLLKIVVARSSSDLPADLEDASQYNFAQSDAEIKAAFENGAEPVMYFMSDKRPADMDAYKRFVKNVIRHYTEGWGGGNLRYPVRVFRFGNEPDGPAFWSGSKQDFFETFAAWAQAVKELDYKFIVGGPGVALATADNPRDNDYSALASFTVSFLDYCERERVPLDYFSFHAYGPIPYYAFYKQSMLVQRELLKHPNMSPLFGAPRLANDEWDFMYGSAWSGRYHTELDETHAAASSTIMLMNMMRQGLWLSIKQGGLGAGNFAKGDPAKAGGMKQSDQRLKSFDKGLDIALVTSNYTTKPSFYAMKAINMLTQSQGALEVKGTDDHMNFASYAAKTPDGSVIIVVSTVDTVSYLKNYTESAQDDLAYSIARREFNQFLKETDTKKLAVYDKARIEINSLPWGRGDSIVVEQYTVESGQSPELKLKRTDELPGAAQLIFARALRIPSVNVFRIYKK